MEEYVQKHNIKAVPHCLLIGSYLGKKIGLSTPLLKWYLKHGYVITNIYTIMEYAPHPTFKNFMTEVAEAQLRGDCDPRYVLRAEMSKLCGNAGYGGLITNQEKHHDIVYVNESQVGREIMDNHFYDLTDLPDGFYNLEKAKKSINLNLPIHLGVFIHNYAKLKMLTFYFDFVNKFLSCQDFE